MKIYPQDLRPSLHSNVIQRRTHAAYSEQDGGVYLSDVKPKRGFLGRFWSRGMDMTPEQAAVGLPAAVLHTSLVVYAPMLSVGLMSCFLAFMMTIGPGTGVSPGIPWSVAAGLTGLLGCVGAFPLGRAVFRSLYARPISVSELEDLLSTPEMDAVEKAYFTLLRDAYASRSPRRRSDDCAKRSRPSARRWIACRR